MRPRVGHIQFLNCYPLYYGLVKTDGALDVDLVKGVPTELNRCLLEGALDISPISSIEYARHSDNLMLMPDFTVSSDGDVRSILLLSKVPPEDLDGRKVALATTSATSRVLVRVLLEKHLNMEPEYIDSPPDLGKMLMEADAALLIGDDALQALYAPHGLHVMDLGGWWKKETGLPFVFAVWAVRRAFAVRCPQLVDHVYGLFEQSLEYSSRHLERISIDISRWEPYTAYFLEDYFRTLKFTFEEPYREGFRLFLREAAALGELKEIPDLEFFDSTVSAA